MDMQSAQGRSPVKIAERLVGGGTARSAGAVVLASLALRAFRAHGALTSAEIRSAERLGDPFASGASDAD